ncbi:helix-turn-helix domain-containing protein [Vibrio breoganii]|uniref:helix-turn-helix domain-containing protein n=1 Tax=Vibrio breoganii TaxID=553239 RepID=UPI000C82E72A|nr:helix-turn-helix transcriptional regulator [Vibrio breoganii]PML85192.1 transcriptional regulator [Vibrio breoganii]
MKRVDELATLLIEQRRVLGIEQKDMYMRIGMKQQQYQRLESGSDVKLSTLLRVLEGLDLELSITPRTEKIASGSTNTLNDAQEQDVDLKDDADDLSFWFNTENET